MSNRALLLGLYVPFLWLVFRSRKEESDAPDDGPPLLDLNAEEYAEPEEALFVVEYMPGLEPGAESEPEEPLFVVEYMPGLEPELELEPEEPLFVVEYMPGLEPELESESQPRRRRTRPRPPRKGERPVW